MLVFKQLLAFLKHSVPLLTIPQWHFLQLVALATKLRHFTKGVVRFCYIFFAGKKYNLNAEITNKKIQVQLVNVSLFFLTVFHHAFNNLHQVQFCILANVLLWW